MKAAPVLVFSGLVGLGRTHNVTQVVTRTDWTLDLPLVTENGDLRLYRIPE